MSRLSVSLFIIVVREAIKTIHCLEPAHAVTKN